MKVIIKKISSKGHGFTFQNLEGEINPYGTIMTRIEVPGLKIKATGYTNKSACIEFADKFVDTWQKTKSKKIKTAMKTVVTEETSVDEKLPAHATFEIEGKEYQAEGKAIEANLYIQRQEAPKTEE